MPRAVSEADALSAARALDVRLDAVGGGLAAWRRALSVELEHGTRWATASAGRTVVLRNNSLVEAGRIALAHLLEFPDYYERLDRMEREAETYWAGRARLPLFFPPRLE